jgi:hypothetical protein
VSAHRHLFQRVAAERQTETRERDAEKASLLLARLFPAQRALVEDPSRRKAALCPRQCGKSYAVLVYGLYVGLLRPGARVLILARTRRQAKGTYWADLRSFCRDFELGAKFNKTELTCTLPNGSEILLSGADTAEEIDKHRGQRYDLIVIDEGKSYSAELLAEMIREVLSPALLAKRGSLCLIGTPGAILAGPFWEITTCQAVAGSVTPECPQGKPQAIPFHDRNAERWAGQKAQWSLHGWTQEDNIFCPWIWQDSLELKAIQGLADDDPAWLREFKGRWVADDTMLVYAYCKVVDDRAIWVRDLSNETPFGLPAGHHWRFVLGMDIGFHDDTSFVVGAWSDTYPALIYVHAEKHPELLVEDIAERTRELELMFGGFDAKVADTGGLGRTIIESLAGTYGVSFEAARKTEKNDHIKLLNSDLLSGKIQVPRESVLVEEWKTAQWEDSTKKKVDPNCDDHASDAALYIWRFCYHHWSRTPELALTPGSDAWWRKHERDQERAYEQQLLDEQRSPFRGRYAHLAKQQNPLRLSWTLSRLKSSLR